MKYLYLLLFVFALPFTVNAQFFEDFEGVATTSGVGEIPVSQGWALYNVDGLTPNETNAVQVTDAWVVAVSQDGANKYAASTSWYSPSGQSNDWMVTPMITVSSIHPFLLFDAMAPDSTYADDYEVLISTTGNTPADFTTVLHSETDALSTFTEVRLDIGNYAGQEVYIAFRNIANNEYMLFIDNITVMPVYEENIAVTGIELNDYSAINTDNTIEVALKNPGFTVINSVDIEWSDGVNAHTQSFTGLDVQPGSTTSLALDAPVNYADVVEKTITVTASNVNGKVDPVADNNSLSTMFHTVSQLATKYVVIEEGTGAWCQFCPRGIVAMEYMYEESDLFPNFIGIAVHNGDPMVLPEYDNGTGLSGLPGSRVDRVPGSVPVYKYDWTLAYNARKDIKVPAEVLISADYSTDTREITTTVSAKFYTNYANSNLRLAAVVVEDSVTAPWGEPEYLQKNYYSGGDLPMGGFEDLPFYVEVAFDRVAIALLGGYDGVVGSVPNVISDGDEYSYSFTYTVPDPKDPDEISLVGLLIDNTTGLILNAKEVDLGSNLAVVENQTAIESIKVYPNPTSHLLNVSFGTSVSSNVRLNVYSMSGAVVKTIDYKNVSGNQEVQVDVSNLSAGEYLVSLSTDKGAVTKTIIVK